ncbi:MAG TPA: DNA gyrase subunit A, partial [Burkholderiaceae bacterium]|nr:DNA gyrase subunit A [Burkholderiaceae bacterium]
MKPVHRRVLFGMQDLGMLSTRPHKKSAPLVGEVFGKFHPHGDASVYDALVRLAQDWNMRYPLVDGQGNFGSIEGDPAAAYRYTECRLQKIAASMLVDIDKDTVDFVPNFDDKEREPTVLPAMLPNLLTNGSSGIAVGMATNIPPHNIGEVLDGALALLKNPSLTVAELMKFIPGPDFPTAAFIYGRAGIRAAYETGRGLVVMRARTEFEEMKGNRTQIVVTEVPYQVNPNRVIERLAELVHEKKIEGISDLRNESSREGMRLVIELKRDAVPQVVLNHLYAQTSLQVSFGVIMLAIVDGRPKVLNLRDALLYYLDHRRQVVTRRSLFMLRQARARREIVEGLGLAIDQIDRIIALIRAAKDPGEAKDSLMAEPLRGLGEFLRRAGRSDKEIAARTKNEVSYFTEPQAKAILEMRLQRLTGLERDKIAGELSDLSKTIIDHLETLDSRPKRLGILRAELIEVKQQFASPRRTTIEELEFEQDVESLIQREDMVVTVTHGGYIKRVPLSTYRAQRRGGKGRAGMATREEDFVSQVFVASTHTPVLFFSTRGMVYKMKVYRLPLGNPQARGKALINLLPLEAGETISTVLPLAEDESSWSKSNIMFATASGYVRRNELSDFVDVKANGKIAMKLDDGDRLIGVGVGTADNDVLLAAKSGKAIRFAVSDVRVF